MEYAQVTLLPNRQEHIQKGRRWVYRTEIASIRGKYQAGDIVDVYDSKGHFVARGYVNPASMITIRILTHDAKQEISYEFLRDQIQRAWEYRQRVMGDTTSCRVIFGEADLLPGLIVDKYGDYLVMQTLALGIDRLKDHIVSALVEVLDPQGIYERNDVPVRELEGLKQISGLIYGEVPSTTVIEENGLKFHVDIHQGQKTGYFLDQRDNHRAMQALVKEQKSLKNNVRVLDAFTHSGGFGLHAKKYGADEVVLVDVSESAIELTKKNTELNELGEGLEFQVGNAFDLLREYDKEQKRFDIVILDPPAFAKSKSALEGAYRGYKEINLRAMRLLTRGGILITCSCSYHMQTDMFQEMLEEAAKDTGKLIRLREKRAAALDHPVLLGAQETNYLKCFIVEIL